MKTLYYFAPFFLLLFSYNSQAQFSSDLEAGYVFSIPYNAVRIPSEGGTHIDLAHDLKPVTACAFRARLNYTIAHRHVLSVLVAPLTIKSSGTLDKEVVYSGQTFSAYAPLNATYTFNSYRLTYRYLFVHHKNLSIGAGLTAKVRQANITLQSGSQSADYPDLGLVPLINFYLSWSPSEHWMLLVDGDALVSTQGRAEDVFAGVAYRLSDFFAVKAGYRILEGGANVERNYNFSFFNYAVLGVLLNY